MTDEDDAPAAQASLFDEEPEAAAGGTEDDGDHPGRAKQPGRRSTFALGRTDRRTTELRVIDDAASPISGPFRVKAVVRDGDARGTPESPDG